MLSICMMHACGLIYHYCPDLRDCYFFFFSSRRRHTRFDCDWSSDVCSSDLPLVDLTVVRQRQTVPPMKDRRDHVLRQRRTQPLPQRLGINWPLTGIEGHQVPAAAGPLRDDDRVLADAGHAQEGVFDIPDLDPQATDLDLSVPAAEKLELPLGQPAAIVPTPVQPFVRVVRIGQERSLRALAIIDVSPADTYPGEDDFTWRAERYRRQMLVDDVDAHVVDEAADRDAFSSRHAVHDLVVGVVGGLGQAIRIHELRSEEHTSELQSQ